MQQFYALEKQAKEKGENICNLMLTKEILSPDLSEKDKELLDEETWNQTAVKFQNALRAQGINKA